MVSISSVPPSLHNFDDGQRRSTPGETRPRLSKLPKMMLSAEDAVPDVGGRAMAFTEFAARSSSGRWSLSPARTGGAGLGEAARSADALEDRAGEAVGVEGRTAWPSVTGRVAARSNEASQRSVADQPTMPRSPPILASREICRSGADIGAAGIGMAPLRVRAPLLWSTAPRP
jgi:hypothetical protein